MTPVASHEEQYCANCGASLQGEFCHACGQSAHSVVRPVHALFEETIETLLHIDGRIIHTLPPLLFKPGFLTLEYFSGRRVRYVAPFRLMFVLCALAFFVLHLSIDHATLRVGKPEPKDAAAFQDAKTPESVREQLKDQLADVEQARSVGALTAAATGPLNAAEQSPREQANQRLIALGAAPIPAASSAAPAAVPPGTDRASAPLSGELPASPRITIKTHPVRISWLPAIANDRLNLISQRVSANWHIFQYGDEAAKEAAKQRMLGGLFGALTPSMLILMPVFALLLKLAYLFRRRLYMEHLIVALHSHAFLFFSLLLGLLLQLLDNGLHPYAPWTTVPVGWLQNLLWLWAPIYLLIMQKRVYRQTWPMTLLKFALIGICYCWLLLVTVSIPVVLGLAR